MLRGSSAFRGSLSGHLSLTSSPYSASLIRSLSSFRSFTTEAETNAPMTGVRSNHQFDQQKLFQYLSSNGIEGFNNATQCTIKQFSHGQSNPTFMIVAGNGKKFTVRKQPPGLLPLPISRRISFMMNSRRSLTWGACCRSRVYRHDCPKRYQSPHPHDSSFLQ